MKSLIGPASSSGIPRPARRSPSWSPATAPAAPNRSSTTGKPALQWYSSMCEDPAVADVLHLVVDREPATASPSPQPGGEGADAHRRSPTAGPRPRPTGRTRRPPSAPRSRQGERAARRSVRARGNCTVEKLCVWWKSDGRRPRPASRMWSRPHVTTMPPAQAQNRPSIVLVVPRPPRSRRSTRQLSGRPPISHRPMSKLRSTTTLNANPGSGPELDDAHPAPQPVIERGTADAGHLLEPTH